MQTDDETLRRTAASLRQQLATEHPPAGTTLVAYIDGTLDPLEREAVEEHLAGCTVCSEDVADLRNMREASVPETPQRARWTHWLVAAAIAAVALLAGIVFLRRPQPTPLSIPQRMAYRRPNWDRAVREARAAGRLDMPAALRALQTTPDVIRGTQGTNAAGTFQPSGTIVESPQPRFTWPATAGARYVVSVAVGTQEVEHSGELHDAAWTPPEPLPRGATYTWQVDVRDHDRTRIIPAPPHPALLFCVLDATSANEIADARRTNPDDHLLLGVLYARGGVQDRASDELSAWLAAHPDDFEAQRLLESISRWKS